MAEKLPEGLFNIVNGPSKFDLMSSLFDGKIVRITCDLPLPLTLHELVSTKEELVFPEMEVIFNGIEQEDGSHDSWVGSVTFCGNTRYENERRRFYYSSKKRKGVICERAEQPVVQDDVWDKAFKK